MVSGTMVTRAGGVTTQVPIYEHIGDPTTPGFVQITDDADNPVFVHIIFGNPYHVQYCTEVTLFRIDGDHYLLGNVHSTWNQ